MKKQILVTAIAMAFGLPLTALAQTVPNPISVKVGTDTNLSISGLFAAGVKFSQVNGNIPGTTQSYQPETRIDDNTSRLIFGGSSDFGDGLKGIFRVESRFFTTDTPATPLYPTGPAVSSYMGWADGDTWVGVAGSWGQVIIGKSTLYYTDTLSLNYLGVGGSGEGYRIWDGNGLGTFNLLSQVGNNTPYAYATLGMNRSNSVIRFDSARMDGVDFSLAYSPNPSGSEPEGGAAGLPGTCTASATNACASGYSTGGTVYGRVRYDKGPIDASLSVLSEKVAGGQYNPEFYAGPLDTQAYRAGVSYTFPEGVRVGLVYDNTSVANGIAVTGGTAQRAVWSVPVSYAWGKNQAYFTYTRAGSTSNISNSGATQMNLGYDYALSKTTFVGVMYTSLSNDANGQYSPFLTGTALGGDGPNMGQSWQQLSFDINYWF